MPKVMVTGGGGFVGSHLCEALIARGDQVVALDNFATSHPDNLSRLRDHPRFTLVEGSVLDQPLVERVAADCDWTAHLASAVGVRLIMERPLESLRTIVRGTEHVLEAAHRHQHQQVVLTSTSEIYGRNTGTLHEDATRLLGPTTVDRWSYSAGKTVDEFLAFGCWREHGLPTKVVRLFNTVGPRQSPAYGMVLPRFVDQALAGDPLTVYGNGMQSRTFCYVDDAVEALLRLAATPAATGLPVNVGSEDEVTILELAHQVLRVTGSTSEISHVDFQRSHADDFEEVPRRRPSIDRARQLIGWQPHHTLRMIIEAVVEDRQRRRAYAAAAGGAGAGGAA